MTRSGSTERPTFAYLFCYGAIGIPTLPDWNTTFQIILELGGMVAIANIRGGGEFGFNWQAPGKLDRRTTLEDLATASRWLRETYAINHIVLSGRSYGGMHALAAMTHAQAAYDVVVPAVPVTDTIQFLETERFGRSVWDDFGLSHNDNGDFLKTPEEIATLKMWSPLQNIALLRDPVKPTLLLTADTDERVEPAQTVRMAKALQEQFGLDAPVYLWVEPSAGHAASTGVDELTFIAKQLDIAALKPLVPRSGP